MVTNKQTNTLQLHIHICASTDEMGGKFLFLEFALIFAHVINSNDACKSDDDCRKTTQYATRCCRENNTNSNLDCYNVSSCAGRYCEATPECGDGLCCEVNICTGCLACLSKDECKLGETCCKHEDAGKKGECKTSCADSPCLDDKQCAALECCRFGDCVNKGCVSDNIFIAVVSTSLGLCVIFFIAVVAYVVYKYFHTKRGRTVAPRVALENRGQSQTCTVLTMPTTYQCTSQNN